MHPLDGLSRLVVRTQFDLQRRAVASDLEETELTPLAGGAAADSSSFSHCDWLAPSIVRA
jgi:hypothetical protein